MKNLWHNFITSGGKFEENSIELFRLKLINILCFLSTFTTSALIINDYQHNNFLFFVVDLVALLTIISVVILLRFKPIVNELSTLFIIMLFSVMTAFFVTSPEKLIISAVVPIITMLLKGKVTGLKLSLAFFAWLILLVILSFTKYISLSYTLNALLPAFLTYIFTVIFIYMNQNLVESKEQIILEKNKTLQESYKQLEEETKSRRQTEEELKKRTAQLDQHNAELKQMNDAMIGRELKMVELKNRVAELEAKLGIQSSNSE
jgi:glucan phosphoethanolaminetransferase (alkaline phosphatase superfamily)